MFAGRYCKKRRKLEFFELQITSQQSGKYEMARPGISRFSQ